MCFDVRRSLQILCVALDLTVIEVTLSVFLSCFSFGVLVGLLALTLLPVLDIGINMFVLANNRLTCTGPERNVLRTSHRGNTH